MDNSEMILDFLARLDAKIDKLADDISNLTLKNKEQEFKLDSLEKDTGFLSGKIEATNERLKDAASKKDVDVLFDRVRAIESAPTQKLKERVSFAKKAVYAGIAALITGAVVFLGKFLLTVLQNLNVISEAVEKLK